MNKPTIVLCHGVYVSDFGDGSIDRIEPFFSDDYKVLQADYGYLLGIGARWSNGSFARIIAGMTPANSIGIGHSNGAAILYRACTMGAKFSRLILINPALKNDIVFPSHIERIDVFYSPGDRATKIASYLPFRGIWGEMGTTGYVGKHDFRVSNNNENEIFGTSRHSEVFQKQKELAGFLRKEMRLDQLYL